MKKVVLLFVWISSCSFLFSQTLLWKISGKDLISPSYFYGSIHIQDQRVFDFSDDVSNALESCDAFAMEVLLDEVDPVKMQNEIRMPKGKVLSDLMTKEDFRKLDSLCKEKMGVSAIFVNTYKPFFLCSALQQADIPKEKDQALDLFFLKCARKMEKSCYGLEDFMDQINMLNKMTINEQIDMLVELVNETAHENESQFDALLQAYLSFDFDKMEDLFDDPNLSPKMRTALFDKRNVNMVNAFLKIGKKKSVFATIGAGHLIGPKGVLKLLEKKGYTVEPVQMQFGTR